MISILRRSADRKRAGDDAGVALITVIGSMLILTMTASAGLAYATQSMPQARHDQDYSAALTAAQSGIDDYIRHLNNDDSYWQSAHCENIAQTGPNDPNCLAAQAGWQPVNPGDTGSGPSFHYDVDTSTLATANNSITVTSTGRVNGVTRTIQASVSRGGSTQFVYYTDYEDVDPTNTVIYPTPPTNSYCYVHWWEGRNTHDSGCVEIQFASGDVIMGKVHTNDTPLMGGNATFGDVFETSDKACASATASNDYAACYRGSGSPIFKKPPTYAPKLTLPNNTTSMSTYPGCDYTGSTRIRFTGDGNMLVWSKNSNVSSACGGSAPMGVSVPVPNNEVIYVTAASSSHQCAAGEIGDGLPVLGDTTMALADQACGLGNLYVEGSVKGRVTLAAENDLMISGDITLRGGLNGSDMVGLVAGNSVEVMHPWLDFDATSCPSGTSAMSTTWSRTPGTWISKGAGGASPQPGQVWRGENWNSSSGTWVVTPGGWVTQPTDWKGRAELWQAGYFQGGSWVSGKWVAKSGNYGDDSSTGWHLGASNTYWQGETWAPKYDCQGESSSYPTEAKPGDLQIYASIQTLNHSFLVQNYNVGTDQGKLDVFGSIAQHYRGIVGQTQSSWQGTTLTGYLKNYNYDSRLVYSSPPYFPQWVDAKWSSGRVGEIAPMYSSG